MPRKKKRKINFYAFYLIMAGFYIAIMLIGFRLGATTYGTLSGIIGIIALHLADHSKED